MKYSATILLLSISAFAFQTNNNSSNSLEPAKKYLSDTVNIAVMVKDQIDFARKNPGRSSFAPDPLKESKRAEISEGIFSFIYRQYISINSLSNDSKIKILAAIMFFLGVTLIILLLKIIKMKRESGFIHKIKSIKAGMAAEPGLISSNLKSIKKLLCENPVSLYSKMPGNEFPMAVKELNIAKGEAQLAAKIRAYRASALIPGENNGSKISRGVLK